MNKTFILTKLFRASRLIVWLFFTVFYIRFFFPKKSLEQRDEKIRQICQKFLNIINAKLDVRGQQPENLKHVLVVANHVSWLDIFAINACYPLSMIAKREIALWPIIGNLVKNAGAVFIDRNSRRDTKSINKLIAEHLNHNRSIAFFPEARTCVDGLHILPFKASLFQSAFLSQSKIQAMTIRYYDNKNRRTTAPAYLDGVNLIQSVFRVLSLKTIVIKLDLLPMYDPEDYLNKYLVESHALKQLKAQVEHDVKVVVESDIPSE